MFKSTLSRLFFDAFVKTTKDETTHGKKKKKKKKQKEKKREKPVGWILITGHLIVSLFLITFLPGYANGWYL